MNQRWGRKRDFREIAFLTLVSYMAVSLIEFDSAAFVCWRRNHQLGARILCAPLKIKRKHTKNSLLCSFITQQFIL
jgi:hypothetical protein